VQGVFIGENWGTTMACRKGDGPDRRHSRGNRALGDGLLSQFTKDGADLAGMGQPAVALAMTIVCAAP